MAKPRKRLTVLIVEDDEDDRELSADALAEGPVVVDLRFVEDGEELMEYLERHGVFSDATDAPRPDLVLLDLKMPRKSGWEALAEIKANPDLKSIPVVVLSTSNAQIDVHRCYELGASSYMTKPNTFDEWVRRMQALEHYWFEANLLPEPKDAVL